MKRIIILLALLSASAMSFAGVSSNDSVISNAKRISELEKMVFPGSQIDEIYDYFQGINVKFSYPDLSEEYLSKGVALFKKCYLELDKKHADKLENLNLYAVNGVRIQTSTKPYITTSYGYLTISLDKKGNIPSVKNCYDKVVMNYFQ